MRQADYVPGETSSAVHPAAWTSGNSLNFTVEYFGKDTDTLVTAFRDDPEGFHPGGCNTPEGYAIHEYGHWLDQNSGSAYAGVPGYSEWRQEALKQDPVSGYGATNDKEQIAELFSAAFTPTSTMQNDPRVVDMRDTFTKLGLYIPPATKITKPSKTRRRLKR